VKESSHPLLAIPAGLRTWAKAAYLFGQDPTMGADPDVRILAPAKYNFGLHPKSRRFAFTVTDVQVVRASGRGSMLASFGKWLDIGDTTVTATAMLVKLKPESKDRLADRAGWELVRFLREGKDGHTRSSIACKAMGLKLDPPIPHRTMERAAKELGIERIKDPKNKSKIWWKLPEHIIEAFDWTDDMDDIEIERVDIPDAPPEDWS
jgi:hypothetical protein